MNLRGADAAGEGCQYDEKDGKEKGRRTHDFSGGGGMIFPSSSTCTGLSSFFFA